MEKIWLHKLQEIMRERGIKAKPLSINAGLNETYIRDLEKKGTDPTVGKLAALADALGLPITYFFDDKPAPPRQIQIVGYASAGEEWLPIDDHSKGDGIEVLSLDVDAPDSIAIRVRGHSMTPVFRDGDDLVCSRQRGLDLVSVIGKDCVVKTIDQRCYIKQVFKGSVRNTYRLRSYNPSFGDIENVALEWAAPIVWIKRTNKK